jgi:uncharacterized protein involved in exopolysaccharide biosynthesis
MRLRQRLWYIAFPIVACAATAGIVGRYLPSRYQSETLILVVPQRVAESYVPSTVTTTIEERLQSITQLVLSRTRLERIIQDFNLYADARRTGIMEDIVEGMRRDIGIQVVKGDAFRVSYIGDEPRTAMRVTERLASLFIEENLRARDVLAEGTAQFLDTQIEETRSRIVDKEAELKRLRADASAAATLPVNALEFEVLKNTYKTLLVNRQHATMAVNLEGQQLGEQFKLLDPARMAERPIAPDQRGIIAAGGGVGLCLGLVRLRVRRKKLSPNPDAAAVSPWRGRLSIALRGLVFVFLVLVLVYEVMVIR